jgi:hypothetical protein
MWDFQAELRTARRIFLLIVTLGLLAGCPGFVPAEFTQPTITDTTTPWLGGTARIFTARVDVPTGFRVDRISVRYARHFYPGAAGANLAPHSASIGSVGLTGPVAVAAPGAAGFPVSHALFYQWVLEYSLAVGGAPISRSTAVTRFVIGCPQAVTDAQLTAAMMRNMTRFTTARAVRPPVAIATGYPLLPHGRSSIRGNGFTRSTVPLATLLGAPPGLNRPNLLFYAPRPQNIAGGELDVDYVNDVSDPNSINNPYSFIGVAHTQLYDPDNRPIMGCIPSDAWFVHEAGYHLSDGGMAMTRPDNDIPPGARNMQTPLPRPRPPNRTIGHARLWDLHVWADPAGGTTPILRINRPGGVPGLRLPPRAFFRPRTFE